MRHKIMYEAPIRYNTILNPFNMFFLNSGFHKAYHISFPSAHQCLHHLFKGSFRPLIFHTTKFIENLKLYKNPQGTSNEPCISGLLLSTPFFCLIFFHILPNPLHSACLMIFWIVTVGDLLVHCSSMSDISPSS